MFRRVDIPEGSERIPWASYGRIRSAAHLEEWYATVTIFGWIVFVASGRYGMTSDTPYDREHHGRRRWRGWVGRRVTVQEET